MAQFSFVYENKFAFIFTKILQVSYKMSLFPAYSTKDSSEKVKNESDQWLKNESYQKSQRNRSRSRTPERRKYSSKRSRDDRRRRSRSRDRHNRKRRSRSRSRSKSRKSKKRSRRSSSSDNENSSKLNREELIVKHSSKKTFLEDVGVLPENAFRIDPNGDQSLVSAQGKTFYEYWKTHLI